MVNKIKRDIKSDVIKKAATLARGDRYSALNKICDNQNSVSTKKLTQLLSALEENDRLQAIYLKTLVDTIL